MALTRKALRAMGLTDEQVDSIAEEHGETVKALKDENEALKAKLANYDTIKTERDDFKTRAEDYKAKYDREHADLEDYKHTVAERDAKTAKEAAAKAYFESKGITGANLDIALRGADGEIKALTVEDGKITDTSGLDGLVSGIYSGLVVTQETRGAKMATPPATGGKSLTKEEIFAIRDTAERQKAIKENPQLFT